MKEDKKIILKVLVGSHAHGLADENSDRDYRAVYVLPTKKILSLGFRYRGTNWVEGNIDNTAYEMGHFLHLATKCNPTTLEVFKAPIIEVNQDGLALRKLFPYVWNPQDAFNAFVGYGLNQRKKFLNKKDGRPNRFAIAYIRTLLALNQLLVTGTFDVRVENKIYWYLFMKWKKGYYAPGEVINEAEILTDLAKRNLEHYDTVNKDGELHQVANIDKINQFLLDIRKKYWEI